MAEGEVIQETGAKKNRLSVLVQKNVNSICVLSYVLGIAWFLALSYRDFGAAEYHSENALLTGLQQLHFHRDQVEESERHNKALQEFDNAEDSRSLHEKILGLMEESGINGYSQTFSSRSPLPEVVNGKLQYKIQNGTNVYGIIRAGRASSTESIVLNVPISPEKHNYAIGIILALGNQAKSQLFWAKDIILLFTEHGYVGAQAWLQSYYDAKNSDFITSAPLEERAGTILGSLVLDMPEVTHYVNAEVVGNNGQLPNLDVFRVFTKLSFVGDVRIAINGELVKTFHDKYSWDSFLLSLKTAVRMVSKQARGFSEGNHAMFLQYNIQSLSLNGVKKESLKAVHTVKIGRLTEGIIRSLNNLLEKLHHSFFFYLISSTDRFISVGLYSPVMGLIILGPVLKALCLWIAMMEDEEKEDGPKEDEDEHGRRGRGDPLDELINKTDDDQEDEEEQDSILMNVFGIFASTSLIGVVLYFSPRFAVAWSQMFGFSSDQSLLLIFLTAYVAGLLVPITVFRMSRDREVLELLRIVGLVLYAGILGCEAVINFSLGLLLSICSVPFVIPIRVYGKIRIFNIVLAILSSPVTVAIMLSAAEQIFSGEPVDLWHSADSILTSLYEQAVLGNNWIYPFCCMLLYPSWLLFWYQAVTTVD